jgi:cytochrome b subunit of formate dehydrogenase
MAKLSLGVAPHFALVVLALAFVSQAPAQDNDNAVCASCHEEIVKKVSPTAHGGQSCLKCHPKHEDYPHPAGIKKPECNSCHTDEERAFKASVHAEVAKAGNASAPDCAVCHGGAHEVQRPSSADFRKGVLDTCGMCHDKEAGDFRTSVHGKLVAQGSMKAAVCSDCHGEHAIQRPRDPESSVNVRHIPETCGQCHSQLTLSAKFRTPLDRVQSFDESFHGLALKSGVLSVANCASCHGVHNILPSTDSKSMIHPKNLAATCGKCHPGTTGRYAMGPVHIVEGKTEPKPVQYARLFYLAVIPATLGFMFLHNIGDWFRKLFRLRFNGKRTYVEEGLISDEIRMHRFERVQHFLLLVSFSVLTWTGFALVYPDHWWARPLLMWENQWPVRGTLHRVAAIVMTVVSVMHVISLIVNRRLREHWYTLFPRVRDIREAMQALAYNLGLRKEKPVISSHSYIEKAEYWAVVWGTVIMVLTGLLLWAATWTMSWAPKWVLDLATAMHFYEAVLAAASILIWHIYYVILDPDVYPMDPAWLTGKSTRIRRRRHGDEEDH